MQKFYLLFLVLFISGISCKKDNEDFVTGTVQVKGGCFSNSWLIAIYNPDPGKHSFLRTTTFTSATFYNCSNAVFIDMPSSLAIAGTRIRFFHIDTQPFSCLSYSEAPNHITVKNLSKL